MIKSIITGLALGLAIIACTNSSNTVEAYYKQYEEYEFDPVLRDGAVMTPYEFHAEKRGDSKAFAAAMAADLDTCIIAGLYSKFSETEGKQSAIHFWIVYNNFIIDAINITGIDDPRYDAKGCYSFEELQSMIKE